MPATDILFNAWDRRHRPSAGARAAGRALALAACCLSGQAILGPSACGGLPLPACVFFGQARDEYGRPYTTNAAVVLRVDGRDCGRWTIDRILAPGVNFRVPLALDDGRGTPYASHAARPGAAVEIALLAGGLERTLVQTHTLLAGQPGDFVPVYVTSGTDADGDGLPDEWEQELRANSEGFFTDIGQIRPEDDFDGDGVSNGEEYRGGTYAFLADDYLYIEEMARLTNGRVRLRFLSAPGITYQVLGTSELGPDPEWVSLPLALDEAAPAQYQAFVGNGYYLSVYLELADARRFLRLEAR